jgi:peptidoglycan/xylan/chitin deacetylase (PgdA/CDA1 family)
MMTPEMIRNLAQQGIEIGAHTVSHPILTSLSDASARHEIAEGKRQLEAILGKPVRYFAYPNGKHGMDFDERHVAMAREVGFDAAFSTALGAASSAHDPYALPRSRPWDTTRPFYIFRMLRWLAQ